MILKDAVRSFTSTKLQSRKSLLTCRSYRNILKAYPTKMMISASITATMPSRLHRPSQIPFIKER